VIRRIIKIGNSEGVVIPASALRAHKLKVGDKVEIIIGPPGEIASKLEFLQELDDFRKFRSQPAKKAAKGQLQTL
jgi:antitoxin component of MazEF toxin-antitoxin module